MNMTKRLKRIISILCMVTMLFSNISPAAISGVSGNFAVAETIPEDVLKRVDATMGVGQTITLAAGLSFLGLGVQPPAPEWGAMLSNARAFMRTAPHLVIFPGLAIAITVLALNLLGDGLRDALDPKLKN